MRSAAFSFLLSLIIAAALTPALRVLAQRRGWLDHAIEARKIHGRPIPRLGGVAIVVAFYAPLLGLLLYPTGMSVKFYQEPLRAWALLGGGLCIALLGLWDDVRGAGAGLKFAVQFAVAGALWLCGLRVETLGLPGVGTVALGLLSLPVTLLWVAGVVNALNLIDGLDGLAGGVAFFALATSFVVAFVRGEATMALLSAALAGSVLGFLVYNFNPASIFMGDTGSMFLGFVLAAGAMQTSQKASTAAAVLIPLVALGVPILDTVLAIGRRATSGRPIFSADREHIHHQLLALGLTHRQAVLVLYAASAALAILALALSFANSLQTAATLTLLTVASALAVRRLYAVGPAAPAPAPRPGGPRQAARALAPQLLRASSVEQAWAAFGPLTVALGAARLVLARPGAAPLAHQGAPRSPAAEPFTASFPLGDEAALGALEAVFDDGRRELDPDREIALEVACDLLAAALQRLAG